MNGVGHSMLLGAGWEEGRGLGPNLNGRIHPIPVKVKLDRFVRVVFWFWLEN